MDLSRALSQADRPERGPVRQPRVLIEECVPLRTVGVPPDIVKLRPDGYGYKHAERISLKKINARLTEFLN
jgi:hypothetical protein